MLELIHTSYMDSFFCFINNYITTILLFFIMCLVILLTKKRKMIYVFVPVFALTGGFIALVKYLTGRARPFEALDFNLISCVDYNFGSWNSAFPSWHAASVFIIFYFLLKIYGKKMYAFLPLAIIFAFSRIYLGYHYWSDVLVGICLGLGVSYYSVKYFRK